MSIVVESIVRVERRRSHHINRGLQGVFSNSIEELIVRFL